MVDQLKEIPKKILDWWNKFEPKQKTLIISAAAGVLVAFAVLVWLLSRPQYVLLSVSETTKETADITALLDGADPAIEYRVRSWYATDTCKGRSWWRRRGKHRTCTWCK